MTEVRNSDLYKERKNNGEGIKKLILCDTITVDA